MRSIPTRTPPRTPQALRDQPRFIIQARRLGTDGWEAITTELYSHSDLMAFADDLTPTDCEMYEWRGQCRETGEIERLSLQHDEEPAPVHKIVPANWMDTRLPTGPWDAMLSALMKKGKK